MEPTDGPGIKNTLAGILDGSGGIGIIHDRGLLFYRPAFSPGFTRRSGYNHGTIKTLANGRRHGFDRNRYHLFTTG